MERREVFQVVQAVAKLVRQPAAKSSLLLHVPCSICGEMHDFDVGTAEPALGVTGEEEKADVPGHVVIVDPYCDAQPPVDLRLALFVQKPASNIAQVLAHLRLSKIADPRVRRPAIVPRHARRLLEKTSQQVSALFGIDCLGAKTDPISGWTATRSRGAVRPHLASGRPHYQDEAARNRLGRQNWRIRRVDPIAVTADPLLSSIDLLGRQATRRKVYPAIPLLHADDDVSAVQVVVVVRECADGAEHLWPGHPRIPRRLELHTLRLHPPAVEKVVQVERQVRAHE